ncbi:MAG: VWA domain-containing protein, partial [Rhodobacter sp.]|nr:VWA domain-containing protein [Rhodobacter sp.]
MTGRETDPLDDLKRAFDSATPAPDEAKKLANLARAQEIFEKMHGASQGSASSLRPTSDRPTKWAGFVTGVGQMFSTLTSRPALTASTALVAVGLVALVPILREGPPDLPGRVVIDEVERPARLDVAPPAPVETTSDERARTVQDSVPAPEPAPAPEQVAPDFVATPGLRTEMDQSGGDSAIGVLGELTGRVSKSGGNGTRPLGLAVEESEAAAVAGLREQPARTAPMPRIAASPADGYADATHQGRPIAPDIIVTPESNTETFANDAPNPVKTTTEEPVSTFSIDVDTASYSVVRSSLMNGYLPDPASVRVEEMVNYFPYAYAAPDADEAPFKPTVSISQTPWNPDTQLLHIALQGRMPAVEDRPALNLVFLIDTSGSMNQPNKLPLLKQSFRLMLGQLSPQDEVSIVTYAGSAGRVLDPTPASDRATILAALDRLNAGGSTAGQQGLQQAYATAATMAEDGEVTRVILATDGDFNVGLSNPEALKAFIADKRDSGTYLSVLGFGRGNLDDATMQALAQNGNGQAAYIDTLSEAQKVLVDQLTGALFPIANDVKIQVEFNPAEVAEYRLIGYETRALRREDF